jgi:aryl-alcohol dehydrogenase-like predicted oxidoreductase
MEYKTLGRSGVKVSPLCLGCMNFGGPTEEAESTRIINTALDAGINFLDTADVYNNGASEQVVGQAIKSCREHVVLATKVHGPMGDDPNAAGNSRAHIMQGVEDSLRRLDTDHIDLYQLHRPDPNTPMDEQLDALSDLVHQGKVRYIGTSTFPAWQLCETLWISEKHNYERFVSEQPPYNMLTRGIENEVLPFCNKYGFAVLPWSPLAGGWLTGKYRKGEAPPDDSRGARRGWTIDSPGAQKRFDIVEQLISLADEAGMPITQLALAWAQTNPIVTAPIIGPRTMEQLEDNLKAAELTLADDLLEKVDQIVPPGTNVPQ